ncbi:hypothetical protein RchiOBHm_Chr5g0008321 [Rosa chinensis]|uniref:Uncharacterized protein n=1 Tax=Rosa chinensis TaxID=74649 RepID=A0A2P6Q428_ROSCH|nr:hypothetical protein RchiOBHm_Chr5g0008321 [Rosa chinensis]
MDYPDADFAMEACVANCRRKIITDAMTTVFRRKYFLQQKFTVANGSCDATYCNSNISVANAQFAVAKSICYCKMTICRRN